MDLFFDRSGAVLQRPVSTRQIDALVCQLHFLHVVGSTIHQSDNATEKSSAVDRKSELEIRKYGGPDWARTSVDLHFATRISDPFEQRGAPGVADSEADEHHAHAGAGRAPRHRPA